MIVTLVILLPILSAALIYLGVAIGWRAAKQETPAPMPSLPAIRNPSAQRDPPAIKPQEKP